MDQIVVKDVVKVFGKNPERGLALLEAGYSKNEILEQTNLTVGVAKVSLTIPKGELFVIMGLSGSGKSTLLRCMNRLHEPTAGQIFVDGEDITQMDRKQVRDLRRDKMGMVFQNFALYPNRTILDNVAFGLEIKGVDKEARRDAAAEAIGLVGLDGYAESYPHELSGGMQQRVGLARALASDPDILLMDEPFSALDPLIRKDMQQELIRLQAKMNKTIVFITHDLDEALSLGDTIAIMRDGRVIQQGCAEDILNYPRNDYVVKFTEDVDRSKILTADAIMEPPKDVVVFGRDGVNRALHKLERHNLANVLVVDRRRRLLGTLYPEDLVRAKHENLELDALIRTEVPTVKGDTPMRDLLDDVEETQGPLAVVDDQMVLKGIIVRGSVVTALTRRGV
jgi:glycine betaine/proline transport system ATP-binding protein